MKRENEAAFPAKIYLAGRSKAVIIPAMFVHLMQLDDDEMLEVYIKRRVVK